MVQYILFFVEKTFQVFRTTPSHTIPEVEYSVFYSKDLAGIHNQQDWYGNVFTAPDSTIRFIFTNSIIRKPRVDVQFIMLHADKIDKENNV